MLYIHCVFRINKIEWLNFNFVAFYFLPYAKLIK